MITVSRLKHLAQDYEKFVKVLNEERHAAIKHLRSVMKENQMNTKQDRVQEGDVFTHIRSGDVVVASTLSDSNFRRYIKYPCGAPAGTVEDYDLLNPKLFIRGEKRLEILE
jgi:hypothetical protein